MNNSSVSRTTATTDLRDSGASKVIVKPVANAVRILRHLGQSGQPSRAAEIARDLAINPSTCFNILRTLVDQDILEFDSSTKVYSISLGLITLVESALIDRQRIPAVRQVMSELAAEFRVTMTLWRRIAHRIVLIGAESSPSDLSISMSEGQRLPVLMGATGRILAPRLGLSEPELRAEFDKIRWARALSFEQYWREVQTALKRGWAVDDGHFSNGIMTMAVPIFDARDHVSHTLSAVMFRGALDDDGMAKLTAALKAASTRISALLF
ncbi:MAG: helix-turn-helix domain-containing protein [Gammaproteobacteria bacterium]|nr:helix-turn-helix domain-containing protein [Gammaproteobacteria bacterium]